jgi:MazG family protein
MKPRHSAGKRMLELIAIMERLRGPQGCPWDKHQSHRSLLPYLFSEAAEVKQAVRKRDWDNLKEELGDVLLQVVFHSQIAREEGRFDMSDVITGISEKLRRRHPHVFGGKKLATPAQVRRQWEEIKRAEKLQRAQTKKRTKNR